MKQDRTEWRIRVDVKSTCGNPGDPPSEMRYQVSGAWSPDMVGAGEVLARDFAAALRAVSRVMVPSARERIVAAFAEELDSGDDLL